MQDDQPTLIVAAHPDDEILGAGIWMARHKNRELIRIVHVTDGSPRNMTDARSAGFSTREEYAAKRRSELQNALQLAGIRPEKCVQLGFVDQEAYLHLPEIVERITALIRQFRPRIVLTHPYEGGHPDHDAAAFAVAQALKQSYVPQPERWEFTSYHAGPEAIVTGEFLRNGGSQPEHVVTFDAAARELKQAMIDEFPTQEQILNLFALDREKFRQAPDYDFTKPPTTGELQYERFGFAHGDEFRRKATESLEVLEQRV